MRADPIGRTYLPQERAENSFPLSLTITRTMQNSTLPHAGRNHNDVLKYWHEADRGSSVKRIGALERGG